MELHLGSRHWETTPPSPPWTWHSTGFWPLQVRNSSFQLLLEFTGFYPWEDHKGKAHSWTRELACDFPQWWHLRVTSSWSMLSTAGPYPFWVPTLPIAHVSQRLGVMGCLTPQHLLPPSQPGQGDSWLRNLSTCLACCQALVVSRLLPSVPMPGPLSSPLPRPPASPERNLLTPMPSFSDLWVRTSAQPHVLTCAAFSSCDTVIYDKKYIFGLPLASGTELLEHLEFPKW